MAEYSKKDWGNEFSKAMEKGLSQLRKVEDTNRLYVVEIGYYEFEFNNFAEASDFMELAKNSITEKNKTIRMTVTYKEDEDE